DPDVVMVGEIRDRETAEIAVQASLTGHLVLSTVHTNDAIVYVAQGCEDCNQTGYKGRIGVFEAVRIDDTIRRLINTDGHESEITAHAFAKSPNLAQSARDLVLSGQTTAEEAVRVSRRDTTEVVEDTAVA
ncbi:MAG: type II secretion system protein GspE, partial [Sphingomonas sp.]